MLSLYDCDIALIEYTKTLDMLFTENHYNQDNLGRSVLHKDDAFTAKRRKNVREVIKNMARVTNNSHQQT